MEKSKKPPAGKIKMVLLDVDGTIKDRVSDFDVPAAVLSAFREAEAAGVIVALASARPPTRLYPLLEELGLTEYAIASDGSDIIVKGEVTSIPIDRWIVEGCKRLWLENDLTAWLADAEHIWIRDSQQYHTIYNFDNYHDPELASADDAAIEEILATYDCFTNIFLAEHDGLSMDGIRVKAREIFGDRFRNEMIEQIEYTMVAVHGAGVDKAHGMLLLAEKLGIRREEIMAIGNDENDIPMLQAAGLGVAVANAHEDVLAIADVVVADVWHAGAADAINQYALGAQKSGAQVS